MAAERTFTYRAVSAQGVNVTDVIVAFDRREALRRLAQDGLIVTTLEEKRAPSPRAARVRKIGPVERILILRQLGLMIRAGVELLEAIDTVASGMPGEGEQRLREVAAGLRRGERLGRAFASGLPSYPAYVYALIEVGEASGALDRVLEDAATQLISEDKIRREIITALTYPAFLITAGGGAVMFLFYEVVPRFARMIGTDATQLQGLGGAVINAGLFFRANAILFLLAVGAALFALVTAASSQRGRAWIYELGSTMPLLGYMLAARERAGWARIMSFSVANGVAILQATDLAAASVPDGRFKRGLAGATRALRAGKRVDQALEEPGLMSPLDLSLLRAGQRSGALATMFAYIAERHEENFREALKRLTVLLEPLAIAFVSIAVGVVALGLVTAMTGVYDSVL